MTCCCTGPTTTPKPYGYGEPSYGGHEPSYVIPPSYGRYEQPYGGPPGYGGQRESYPVWYGPIQPSYGYRPPRKFPYSSYYDYGDDPYGSESYQPDEDPYGQQPDDEPYYQEFTILGE